MSERLRRWTRNPLGSARRGSNPLGVDFFHVPRALQRSNRISIEFEVADAITPLKTACTQGSTRGGREEPTTGIHNKSPRCILEVLREPNREVMPGNSTWRKSDLAVGEGLRGRGCFEFSPLQVAIQRRCDTIATPSNVGLHRYPTT